MTVPVIEPSHIKLMLFLLTQYQRNRFWVKRTGKNCEKMMKQRTKKMMELLALNDRLNKVINQMHEYFLKYMYDCINYTTSISTLSISTLSVSEKSNISTSVSFSSSSDIFSSFNVLFDVPFSLFNVSFSLGS